MQLDVTQPSTGEIIGWAILVALGIILLVVSFKILRGRRRKLKELRPAPPKPPTLEQQLKKERSRREAAEEKAEKAHAKEEAAEAKEQEARRKLEYDERKRAEREERAKRLAELTPEARKAREEELAKAEREADRAEAEADAERRKRKAEEEEHKKAEYRERKEAERLEKERKAREAAEAEAARLRALEEEHARREAERLRQEEERRQKIAAESGRTLIEGLTRTREGGFVAKLAGLFGGGAAEVSEATIGELEEILFTADIGVKTSMRLVEGAQERLRKKELANPGKLRAAIRKDVAEILGQAHAADTRPVLDGLGLPMDDTKPWVIMVVGVNGAGKTTTIGKLAAKLEARGKRVLLAAGDTFRAAATEQLDVWAERAQVPIVKGAEGSDPGSVIFDAVQRGVRESFDVVICDTAGRLHTKASLMEELKKVQRVIGKARADAPDEVLLVLDATMGQNAIQQARQFHDALGVTGIVLTKLDGTAKGGVVIGICDELKIPVRLIGIGESLADLRPFEPEEYVSALFGS
ncbi:signal recognition particle-docking protein FtsY [Vulgatibacter incomptus]|uniref:Signal recognition particle receptor FtsY n=1 Tax=Vulgatibacter incomptus TaxID=1391653 RepID=A0A0K1P8W3_9BACT|nr:signal recognition particle-docking protein FtsY [Vulgatibacter incomptus]AKU89947.1 Signal recognition particle receptor protein FtsY [Vulgatibacter incomptus]